MPIITFNGLPEARIQEYYQKIDEICELIQAKKDAVFFIVGNQKIINTKKTAYVTIEWMRREDKEQLFTDHIKSFFAKDVERIGVFYTDVNSKLYLDGNKIG